MDIANAYDILMQEKRNEHRKKYGGIVDRVFNPSMINSLEDTKDNPLIVFDLLDKLYCELALLYKLDYRIHVGESLKSLTFTLESSSTSVSIKKDAYNNKTYIVIPDFHLPKDCINKVNDTLKNKIYYRNGYRIIKTLEIICKCFNYNGVKFTHIINEQLAKNLRSEGYDNIYKLRGEESFSDQDYVKEIYTDEEVNEKYEVEYQIKIKDTELL